MVDGARFLGRYELLEEIASGGMATVYAARVAGTAGFEKLVALKQMLPGIRIDPKFRTMFLDEARVAAHIRSPHVVSTFDLDQAQDGSLFIVMDLVIGSSLSDLLRDSVKDGVQLPIGAVVELISQAARGLSDAHEATSARGVPLRIVHRDISPQNVLIGADGIARITDFGVAHAAERLTHTIGQNIKGKIAYCSPEQARAEPLDARSDIFALGIVLWETLTLRRLFRRQSTAETLAAVLSAEIPDPRTVRPEIPPELAAIVMRALARDRDQRFQTALEMADALGQLPFAPENIRALMRSIEGERIDAFVARLRASIHRASHSTVQMESAPGEGTTPVKVHRTLAAMTLAELEATRPATPAMSMAMGAVTLEALSRQSAAPPSGVSPNNEAGASRGEPAPPSNAGVAAPSSAEQSVSGTSVARRDKVRWPLWLALGALALAGVLGAGAFFAFGGGTETASLDPAMTREAMNGSVTGTIPSQLPSAPATPVLRGTEGDLAPGTVVTLQEPTPEEPKPPEAIDPDSEARSVRSADTAESTMQSPTDRSPRIAQRRSTPPRDSEARDSEARDPEPSREAEPRNNAAQRSAHQDSFGNTSRRSSIVPHGPSSPVASVESEMALGAGCQATSIRVGQTVSGRTRGRRFVGCGHGHGPERVYRVQLESHVPVEIEATSSTFRPQVFISRTCLPGGSTAGSCHSDVRFTPFQSGTYYIVVDSAGRGGTFRLRVGRGS